MAENKSSKSRLQQDDPSIIDCASGSSSKPVKFHHKSVKKTTASVKTPTHNQSGHQHHPQSNAEKDVANPQKKRSEQSYNPSKHRRKGAPHHQNNTKFSTTLTQIPNHSTPSSSSHMRSQVDLAVSCKTGTPIDNLVPGKVVSCISQAKPSQNSNKRTRRPDISRHLFSKDTTKEKDHSQSNTNLTKKAVMVDPTTSVTRNQPLMVRDKPFDKDSVGDAVPIPTASSGGSNTPNKAKKAQRKRRHKKQHRANSSNEAMNPEEKQASISRNEQAGKHILNMVKPGSTSREAASSSSATSKQNSTTVEKKELMAAILNQKIMSSTKPAFERIETDGKKGPQVNAEQPQSSKNLPTSTSSSRSERVIKETPQDGKKGPQVNAEQPQSSENLPTSTSSSRSERVIKETPQDKKSGQPLKDGFKDKKTRVPSTSSDPATSNTPAKTVETKETALVIESENERIKRLGLEQAVSRLKKEHIIPLQEKNPLFPDALYYCQVCHYHLDSITLSNRHMREKRHKRSVKDRQQNEFIRHLKKPPPAALNTIQELLVEKVLKGSMLDKDDLAQRMKLVENLNQLFSKAHLLCYVVLYGSSLTGFGFKTSDVNLNLEHPGISAPTALMLVLDILNNSDSYGNVKAAFHAKIPHIQFNDVETSLSVELSAGNDAAVMTSKLLCFYAQLDPRVVQLALVFRAWAHMCRLDRQHEGSLPPHSFPIMAIYFLQVYKYTPVLHEIISEWDMLEILSSDTLKMPLISWSGTAVTYLPSPTPDEPLAHVLHSDLAVESDSDFEIDLSSFDLQNSNADSSFLSSPELDATERKVSKGTQALTPVELCEDCIGKELLLADLWLEMLKFYGIIFRIEEKVVDIRTSASVSREQKNWSKKRIGVIDPYLPKRNLCRSLNTQGVFTYLTTRLIIAVLYFFDSSKRLASKSKLTSAVARKMEKNSKRLNVLTTPKTMSSSTSTNASDTKVDPINNSLGKVTDDFAQEISQSVLNEVLSQLEKMSFEDESSHSSNHTVPTDAINKYAHNVAEEMVRSLVRSKLDRSKGSERVEATAERISKQIVSEAVDELCLLLTKKNISKPTATTEVAIKTPKHSSEVTKHLSTDVKYLYEFSEKVFTEGKYPVKVCSLCKREGHVRLDCPDESESIKLCDLEPLTENLVGVLDRLCEAMYERYAPTPQEIHDRDMICYFLTRYLRDTFNRTTTMTLFGSSRNGFGFVRSDLDICMTFEDHPSGEGLDFVRIIEDVAKQLRRHPALYNIIPITTAKVPIVKFSHKDSYLEADISLYNLLAQRNTIMLQCYAEIDRRCKVLGYVMKVFVKSCNIGDASKGSLSSYAYTLMVIFYLQQKEVPVLPVLQELYNGDIKPVHEVDGWNSWFYDDIKNISKAWNGFGNNKESVGELWLGLLRYYTEQFDFKRNVVCIRRKKLLTTFEKEWTSKYISIEDPFDLKHNLATGVSHKMTSFIIKVFVRARERFGTLQRCSKAHEVMCYFDPYVLTGGENAPNERCCRICGKIGHFIRDCPKNKRGRRRRDEKDGEINAESMEIRCFCCGEVGHIKRDCPAYRNKHTTVRQNGVPATSEGSELVQDEKTTSIINISDQGSDQTSRTVKTSDKNRSEAEATKNSPKKRSEQPVSPLHVLGRIPNNLDIERLSDEQLSPSTVAGNSYEMSPRTVAAVPVPYEIFSKISLTPPPVCFQNLPSGSPASTKDSSSPSYKRTEPSPLKSPQLSSSAPAVHNMWSTGHGPGPYSSSFPTRPQWPRSPGFPVRLQFPASPVNAIHLGQLESQIFKDSQAFANRTTSSTNVRNRIQDMKYLEQRSIYGRLLPPPVVMPISPVLMRPSIPLPPFPDFTQSSTTRRSDRPFPGHSLSDSDMTSPLRHQPPGFAPDSSPVASVAKGPTQRE